MLKANRTAQTLIEAKERIDRPGKWCKRAMEKHHRHCMLGALEATTGAALEGIETAAESKLGQAINDLFPTRSGPYTRASVAVFNDHKATKHEDVMRVFDHAIYMASED